MALATAARKTAILELTWDRVDFDRRVIKLATGQDHGNKGRAIVPITNTLHAALLEARESALTPYVVEYAARKVGKVDKGFRAAAKDAWLDVTPHDLRRTAAIWMAERGVPMSEIASYLGHSDSRITERVYARYSPEYLKKAASALEF